MNWVIKLVLLLSTLFFSTTLAAQSITWIEELPKESLLNPGAKTTESSYNFLLENWDYDGGWYGETYQSIPDPVPRSGQGWEDPEQTVFEDNWYTLHVCLVDKVVYLFSHRMREYYYDSSGEMIGYSSADIRYQVVTTIPCSQPKTAFQELDTKSNI